MKELQAYVHDEAPAAGIFIRNVIKTKLGFSVDVIWFNYRNGKLLETDEFVIRFADVERWKVFDWETRLKA